MSGRGLSIEQVRRNFDLGLTEALQGLAPRSHTGLGPHVEEALVAIVLAYPAVGDELVAEARRRFAQELARREHNSD